MRQARPAHELVVVQLRQLVEEGRRLGVLVDLALPAPGDGRRGTGAVDDRQPLVETAREGLRGILLIGAGGGEDRVVGVELRRGAGDVGGVLRAQAGSLQGGEQRHRQGAHGGARLAAAGHEDERQALRLGEGGEAAAGRDADRRAAARARLRCAGERLLGLAGVAHHDHQHLRADPLRQRIPAHHRRGHGQPRETGQDEVGADGRAAHPAQRDARAAPPAGWPGTCRRTRRRAGRGRSRTPHAAGTGARRPRRTCRRRRSPPPAPVRGRSRPPQPSRITESTRSRFSSMSARESAPRLSRTSGSVLDGRTLKCHCA